MSDIDDPMRLLEDAAKMPWTGRSVDLAITEVARVVFEGAASPGRESSHR